MASTARWGLKHYSPFNARWDRTCRNGLYSPLGIETRDGSATSLTNSSVGMASTARWGLKRHQSLVVLRLREVGMASTARWGLKLLDNSRILIEEASRNGHY